DGWKDERPTALLGLRLHDLQVPVDALKLLAYDQRCPFSVKPHIAPSESEELPLAQAAPDRCCEERPEGVIGRGGKQGAGLHRRQRADLVTLPFRRLRQRSHVAMDLVAV